MIADRSYILRFFDGKGVFVVLVSIFHLAGLGNSGRSKPGDTLHVG